MYAMVVGNFFDVTHDQHAKQLVENMWIAYAILPFETHFNHIENEIAPAAGRPINPIVHLHTNDGP